MVLSLENHSSGVPTPWTYAEGNISRYDFASTCGDPAWSKTHCMHRSFMRGNREILWSPKGNGQLGREGKV